MPDEALHRRISDLTALLEVSKHLASTREFVPLLRRVEKAALAVLDCERASVFLLDADSDELYSRVATGEEELRFSARRGLAGDAVVSRAIVNVADAYADPRFNRDIDRKTGYRTRTILSIPLTGHDGAIVGVLQALNKRAGVFDARDEEEGTILGSLAGVAVQRQMLLDEFAEKQRLEHDLQIARDIQRSLLPDSDPQLEGYDVAGWNRAADETGGDCYDYLALSDGRVGMFVADATGHGIGPALIVSECRALFRALAVTSDTLSGIVTRANDLLARDLTDGRFVTAFFGLLDARAHTVEYISAGQGPILHFEAAGGAGREIPASTVPLAVLPEIDAATSSVLRLERGDILLIVTDGFTEWADGDRERFGTERIFDVVRAHRRAPARSIIDAVHRAAVRFGAGTAQRDDLTAIVVKRE